MENFWKLREMGYSLNDLADRAEYNRLVKSFHEEEERNNLNNLLYGQVHLSRNPQEKTGKTAEPTPLSNKAALNPGKDRSI